MAELCKKCEYCHIHENLIKTTTKDVGIYKFRYETWEKRCDKCYYSKLKTHSIRDFSGHKRHHESCTPKCIVDKKIGCVCWCHSTK